MLQHKRRIILQQYANMSGESVAEMGKPTLMFDNASYINISNNTSVRVTGLVADDVYFKVQNGSNWLIAQGNLINSANKDSNNWYSSDATNSLVSNNVIN